MAATMRVEVAFAMPERQRLVALRVPVGTTARQAVLRAEMASEFPELGEAFFREAPLGIFGAVLKRDDQPLAEGDRVEIYRPLQIDPKQARKQRASQGKAR
ncbi:RnfH family protein [Halomonas sp. ML-15]|uniref:RnfH family protein n=1 Tax=Halomonas sp. ML-15 TaxID=2773305 RepID=UPI001CD0A95A|nr:RnfH family protein [Halomonas sp. ML-15]